MQQGFCLGHQVFTDLVCTPALPAFQLTRSHQGSVHLVLQRGVNVLAMDLQHGAQCRSSARTGLAMPFGGFLFQRCQGFAHDLHGLFNHLRCDLGLDHSGGLGSDCGSRLSWQTARNTQFIGPHGYGRQWGSRVLGSRSGLRHCRLEGVPHHKQLCARGLQQWRKARLHADPAGVSGQLLGLLLPAHNVGTQQFQRSMRIFPGLGGEHLDALGQQHGGFSLHLHTVLQVFDHLHAIGDLHLEQRKRFARKGRARLGRIALPRQGVGNVELGSRQQCLGLLGPLGRNGLLSFGAADFIQPFAYRACSPLVAPAQFLENLLQLLGRRLGGEPVTDAGSPLT